MSQPVPGRTRPLTAQPLAREQPVQRVAGTPGAPCPVPHPGGGDTPLRRGERGGEVLGLAVANPVDGNHAATNSASSPATTGDPASQIRTAPESSRQPAVHTTVHSALSGALVWVRSILVPQPGHGGLVTSAR